MGLFARLFAPRHAEPDLRPLWHRVVTLARQPEWYARHGVADTVAGRFDALSLVLALVLLRMEGEAEARLAAARLTELFVTDMDGQLREDGVGDLVVGKRIGKLMSALGGRLDAYRAALADTDRTALEQALRRNVTLVDSADPAGLAGTVRDLAARLAAVSSADLIAGKIGQ